MNTDAPKPEPSPAPVDYCAEIERAIALASEPVYMSLYAMPGRLPDAEPSGPFATYRAALESLRDDVQRHLDETAEGADDPDAFDDETDGADFCAALHAIDTELAAIDNGTDDGYGAANGAYFGDAGGYAYEIVRVEDADRPHFTIGPVNIDDGAPTVTLSHTARSDWEARDIVWSTGSIAGSMLDRDGSGVYVVVDARRIAEAARDLRDGCGARLVADADAKDGER